jgi:hypothetical protein
MGRISYIVSDLSVLHDPRQNVGSDQVMRIYDAFSAGLNFISGSHVSLGDMDVNASRLALAFKI